MSEHANWCPYDDGPCVCHVPAGTPPPHVCPSLDVKKLAEKIGDLIEEHLADILAPTPSDTPDESPLTARIAQLIEEEIEGKGDV